MLWKVDGKGGSYVKEGKEEDEGEWEDDEGEA